jgi:hypothetical protein
LDFAEKVLLILPQVKWVVQLPSNLPLSDSVQEAMETVSVQRGGR